MQTELTMDQGEATTRFAALLHEHRKIVFKVAASYAWNEADRADLAQEIATQLWSAFPSYDGVRPFTMRTASPLPTSAIRTAHVRQQD